MSAGHRFSPDRIEVAAGETITFANHNSESHSVTAYEDDLPASAEYFASGGFPNEAAAREDVSDGLIKPGDKFSVRLDVPGTYRYFCIPHETEGMVGTIVVTAPES
jgi:plastocyanin